MTVQGFVQEQQLPLDLAGLVDAAVAVAMTPVAQAVVAAVVVQMLQRT